MASGPEHYRKAEELLGLIEGTPEDSVGSVAADAAKAHAHALLALAAATALQRQGEGGMLPSRDKAHWFAAAGTPSPAPIDMEEES